MIGEALDYTNKPLLQTCIKQHVQCILSFPTSPVLDYSQYTNTEERDLVMCNMCDIRRQTDIWGAVSDHSSLRLSSVSGFLKVE